MRYAKLVRAATAASRTAADCPDSAQLGDPCRGEDCKLRIPFVARDTVCRPQKDAGETCWHRKECKSNQCKFTVSPFGPHCT